MCAAVAPSRCKAKRGSRVVDFVISDNHAGLVDAITKNVAGATCPKRVLSAQSHRSRSPSRQPSATFTRAPKRLFAVMEVPQTLGQRVM